MQLMAVELVDSTEFVCFVEQDSPLGTVLSSSGLRTHTRVVRYIVSAMRTIGGLNNSAGVSEKSIGTYIYGL